MTDREESLTETGELVGTEGLADPGLVRRILPTDPEVTGLLH